jgi:carbonic anhydrase
VIQQVNHLAQTSIVQNSWRKTGAPVLHGWVYDLKTGLLNELSTITSNEKLDSIYQFDFDDNH